MTSGKGLETKRATSKVKSSRKGSEGKNKANKINRRMGPGRRENKNAGQTKTKKSKDRSMTQVGRGDCGWKLNDTVVQSRKEFDHEAGRED